jgi:hypothetical protein
MCVRTIDAVLHTKRPYQRESVCISTVTLHGSSTLLSNQHARMTERAYLADRSLCAHLQRYSLFRMPIPLRARLRINALQLQSCALPAEPTCVSAIFVYVSSILSFDRHVHITERACAYQRLLCACHQRYSSFRRCASMRALVHSNGLCVHVLNAVQVPLHLTTEILWTGYDSLVDCHVHTINCILDCERLYQREASLERDHITNLCARTFNDITDLDFHCH